MCQYILATGSVMAKIAEIPEGRGSVRDRLEQEAQFRLAQIKGLLGDSNNNSERTSTSTTVQVYSGRHSTLGDIQRRDFVVPKLSAEREMIEDRLWKVFFEKAGFDQGSMREHANTLCSRLLSGAPGLPK